MFDIQKLEKYYFVYKKYAKNKDTKKKGLSEYQKFIKAEINKEKYKQMKPSERMVKIGKAWKKRLKNEKKKAKHV
jgi:hypothetical protein